MPQAALHQFGLSTTELGWIIGAATFANLLVMPFLGRLVDGWGAWPTFMVAAALNVVAMLALYAAPSLPMLWIATGGVMLATGVMLPSAGAIALTRATPPTMGRLMGLYRTVGEAGMAFGPAVVPTVSQVLGMSILGGLLTCSTVTGIALLAAAAFNPRQGSTPNPALPQEPARR